MMGRRKRAGRDKRRAWLAWLGAFALLVHVAAGGAAREASASPRSLVDALGNSICSAHFEDEEPGTPVAPGDRSHLPDCCLLGNVMAGTGTLPATAGLVLPARRAGVAKLSPLVFTAPPLLVGYSPLNPRAPPHTA